MLSLLFHLFCSTCTHMYSIRNLKFIFYYGKYGQFILSIGKETNHFNGPNKRVGQNKRVGNYIGLLG